MERCSNYDITRDRLERDFLQYDQAAMLRRIPLLGKLDIILQFWDADDEFPPAVRVKWDTHVLSYLRYETTYYAVNCLWQRLREFMQ